MAFQLGNSVFVHADAVVKGTPLEGPKAKQPFTFRSSNKLEAKNNGKVVSIVGTSLVPVAIATASAEPSFSMGFDVGQEMLDYAEHCGDGALRMNHNFVISLTRSGLRPVVFELITCGIEQGFGLMADAGAQVKDEMSGKCRQIILKIGGKPINVYALPGGVNL